MVNINASISINDISLAEGDAGTKSFDFTVTLSSAGNVATTVDFVTENGTVSASSDYQPASGTLTFNPGDLTKTITVPVNGDPVNENDDATLI